MRTTKKKKKTCQCSKTSWIQWGDSEQSSPDPNPDCPEHGTDAQAAALRKLPVPECKNGYPYTQLEKMFGTYFTPIFKEWMSGQTVVLCDGRLFDSKKNKYIPSNCGPHGGVCFSYDVERFINGLPVID